MNTVLLMGRLVRDPELRRTQSGTAVTSFTLAVDRGFADKDGNRQADFIDCVAWKGTAEFVAKWFVKGQMAAVAGALRVRSWEDNEGNRRKAVEVVVSTAEFCGGKKDAPERGAEHASPAVPAEPVKRAIDIDAGIEDDYRELDELSEDYDLPY